MMNNAFKEAEHLFREGTQYTQPLSYNEWMGIPYENKAAVLFVQFYNQITLAWFKTKSFFALEEDGVSIVLQYLMKNVPLIEKDNKRFSPAYIYKVSYNCLYCISHDIQRDIERYEKETSNIVRCGEDQLDLFDTVAIEDDLEARFSRKEFWDLIEHMDLKTQKVINHLLNNGSLKKVSKRNFNYRVDPLRDISVSLDEMEKIMQDLRGKLAKFSEVFN